LFLTKWVRESQAEARKNPTDRTEPDGASLGVTRGSDVIGYLPIVWESKCVGFRSRGVPLVHPIAVVGR